MLAALCDYLPAMPAACLRPLNHIYEKGLQVARSTQQLASAVFNKIAREFKDPDLAAFARLTIGAVVLGEGAYLIGTGMNSDFLKEYSLQGGYLVAWLYANIQKYRDEARRKPA